MNGTLPYSIGLETCNTENEEYCDNFLVKGVTLPTCVKKTCYASSDNQSRICLEILKNDVDSDTADIKDCQKLGAFEMPLPAGIKEYDPIELIFTAGLNGLLICTCKCKGSITEKTIDL